MLDIDPIAIEEKHLGQRRHGKSPRLKKRTLSSSHRCSKREVAHASYIPKVDYYNELPEYNENDIRCYTQYWKLDGYLIGNGEKILCSDSNRGRCIFFAKVVDGNLIWIE